MKKVKSYLSGTLKFLVKMRTYFPTDYKMGLKPHINFYCCRVKENVTGGSNNEM